MKSPATDAGALHIPVIDILPGSAEIASHLVDAAARYGFVFVKGEGLGFSSQSIDDAFSLVRPTVLASGWHSRLRSHNF